MSTRGFPRTPEKCASWLEWDLRELEEMGDVLTFEAELSASGATVVDAAGSLILHAKPVRWVTNSRAVKESLSLRCSNYSCSKECWHDHGKGNNDQCPPRLVSAILAAVRQELISCNAIHWLDAGQHVDEPDEGRTHAD